jgi:hypothetical protein
MSRKVLRREPAFGREQEVLPARSLSKEIPVRIDDEFEVCSLHRCERRLTIDDQ